MVHEKQAVLLSMGWHVLAGLGRGGFPHSYRGATGSNRIFTNIGLYKLSLILFKMEISSLSLTMSTVWYNLVNGES